MNEEKKHKTFYTIDLDSIRIGLGALFTVKENGKEILMITSPVVACYLKEGKFFLETENSIYTA